MEEYVNNLRGQMLIRKVMYLNSGLILFANYRL